MICPNCNSENREGAKFCDECGARLIDLDMPAVVPDQAEEPADLPTDEGADQQAGEGAAEGECLSQTPDAAPNAQEEPTEASGSGGTMEMDPLEASKHAVISRVPEVTPLSGLDVESQVMFDVTEFEAAHPQADLTRKIPQVNEGVVGADYKAPEKAWSQGDTMEMKRTGAAETPESTDFRAPDPNDKNRRKEARALRKKQKAAERAAKGGGKGGKIAIIVIICLLAVGAAAALGTYYLELWGGKTLPDCAGETQADATYVLQNNGFDVRVETVASDDTEGLVLMSDPAPGTRLEKGTEVVLYVATSRVIPDVHLLSVEDATAKLAASGYENITDVSYEKSDEYDNQVLSISPESGSKAKSTAKISLVVAQAYTVPDVSGQTEQAATETINNAGYTVYVAYMESTVVPEGMAISTYPAAGERVESGTTITLNVCQMRATRLQQAARDYFASNKSIVLGTTNYEVDSLDSLSYLGNNQVAFSVTARPYTTFLGQVIYLQARSVEGTLTFDDNDKVVSIS
ncbi:MAG: PASTA domain-containing protein [Coriobacteriia bacterium]|nr:PASTA domain-containing protein [Coriobacteriia bacterium]